MVKCKKHGIWLRPPVGCWKCFEEKKPSKDFIPMPGPKIPRRPGYGYQPDPIISEPIPPPKKR